jgi:hypothetical protein
MHRRARPAISGLVLLCLAACGGAPDPQDGPAAGERAPDAEETVFDDMIQTQDKARAVEGVTLGHKSDLDAAIEESSGGSDKQRQ